MIEIYSEGIKDQNPVITAIPILKNEIWWSLNMPASS